MTSPVFFTVEGDFRAVVEDAASDADYNPEISPISATVTFTPVLESGDVILATGASPRPTAFVGATITAIIDPADGRLKLRTATDVGASGFTFAPVRLLADTPLLELESPLFYRVEFTNVQFGSPARLGRITGFTFQALSEDAVLNLVEVGRVPGQPAAGLTRGPVGATGAPGASGASGASGPAGPAGLTTT